MRDNFRLPAVLAFHFRLWLAWWRNHGHDGDAIVVSLLPLEAVIDKLQWRIIHRDFADRDAGGTPLFASVDAIDIPQVSYLLSLE